MGAQWLHEVDLSKEWEDTLQLSDSEELYIKIRTTIVAKLKEHHLYTNKDEFSEIVDELEQQSSIEDFDEKFNEFYDYCDEHKIWVKTIF